MSKALPVIDMSGPVCCAPMAAGVMDEATALEVAVRLKALSDPARLRVMSLVLASDDGACTCDVAPAVGLTEATVSHHLKVLREAGLVEREKVGTNVYYRARRDSLAALVQVIDPACC
jgi:ArsR family transcriptional regulator, arsenate/arsenite/antimonite-responsive transcriptional repressor